MDFFAKYAKALFLQALRFLKSLYGNVRLKTLKGLYFIKQFHQLYLKIQALIKEKKLQNQMSQTSQTNKINKANQTNQMNQTNQTNKISDLLKKAFINKASDSFSSKISRYVFKLSLLFNRIPFSKLSLLISRIPFAEKIFKSGQKANSVFLVGAVLLSLGIFYFMSILISTGKNMDNRGSPDGSIEFLLNEAIDDIELRSRRLPKKPEEEEPPPEAPKLKVQQTEMEKPELSSHLPHLELPEDFQSDKRGANVGGRVMRDSAVTPIFRMNPLYPRRAAMQDIEGFVILKFDITETGRVDNISVIQASPPQIFNSSAVQALRKWKYKPRMEGGKAVRQKNLKVQLDFRLTGE